MFVCFVTFPAQVLNVLSDKGALCGPNCKSYKTFLFKINPTKPVQRDLSDYFSKVVLLALIASLCPGKKVPDETDSEFPTSNTRSTKYETLSPSCGPFVISNPF